MGSCSVSATGWRHWFQSHFLVSGYRDDRRTERPGPMGRAGVRAASTERADSQRWRGGPANTNQRERRGAAGVHLSIGEN